MPEPVKDKDGKRGFQRPVRQRHVVGVSQKGHEPNHTPGQEGPKTSKDEEGSWLQDPGLPDMGSLWLVTPANQESL